MRKGRGWSVSSSLQAQPPPRLVQSFAAAARSLGRSSSFQLRPLCFAVSLLCQAAYGPSPLLCRLFMAQVWFCPSNIGPMASLSPSRLLDPHLNSKRIGPDRIVPSLPSPISPGPSSIVATVSLSPFLLVGPRKDNKAITGPDRTSTSSSKPGHFVTV